MHCAAGIWVPRQPPRLSTCGTFAEGFNVTAASGNITAVVTAGDGGGGGGGGGGNDASTVAGFVLGTLPASKDQIANGLRSGTYLGGIGTGGYELRADGTFHLSTIRNQSPASEPWQ